MLGARLISAPRSIAIRLQEYWTIHAVLHEKSVSRLSVTAAEITCSMRPADLNSKRRGAYRRFRTWVAAIQNTSLARVSVLSQYQPSLRLSAFWIWILTISVIGLGFIFLSAYPRFRIYGDYDLVRENRVTQLFALENEERKTWAQIAGGVIAILALSFAWRRVINADRNLEVLQRGQIADRYTEAIEQLGKYDENNVPSLEIRLGAIYALEKIAFDSARDHWTIMEVLTAYVRLNSPLELFDAVNQIMDAVRGPRTDIQAALTVIARRKRDKARETRENRLNLSGCNLRGTILKQAHFERADFSNSDLHHANLAGAYLNEATLANASFQRADLESANLSGAILSGVNFEESILRNCLFAGDSLLLFNAESLGRANFDFAQMLGAAFFQVKLGMGSFIGAKLDGGDFRRAALTGSNFRAASLKGTNFTSAFLEAVEFSEANLEGACLTGAKGLKEENFRGALIKGTDFTGTGLEAKFAGLEKVSW
jgi:uncharacterized protein YjbI with pentapeptide repeats